MKIEVLGPGCPKCLETERSVQHAIERLGLDAAVDHVYDVKAIVDRGVLFTPAVAIDGQVVLSGRVPTVAEVVSILEGRSP